MNVIINGTQYEMPTGTCLADAVTRFAGDRQDVAAALNGEVVRRAIWPETTVADGDRVEVLAAVQGG